MIWLVSYDIASPKRLKKVADFCEKFGIRLQKSTFQVDAGKETLEKLHSGLKERINRKYDSVIFYPICEDCMRLSMTDGPNELIDPDKVIIL
ncbi:MAG: CRISPR-associated endonuclease Cas2 [Smithella sp.]